MRLELSAHSLICRRVSGSAMPLPLKRSPKARIARSSSSSRPSPDAGKYRQLKRGRGWKLQYVWNRCRAPCATELCCLEQVSIPLLKSRRISHQRGISNPDRILLPWLKRSRRRWSQGRIPVTEAFDQCLQFPFDALDPLFLNNQMQSQLGGDRRAYHLPGIVWLVVTGVFASLPQSLAV